MLQIPTAYVIKTAAAIKWLALGIALIGVVASYGTQVTLLLVYGVGSFAYVLPATVDLLAVCATLALQLPGLDRASRWIAGTVLTLTVGVSVSANLAGGHNPIARAAHAWPVIAYLMGELIANRVRAYAARLSAAEVGKTPTAPAAVVPADAPVSPGQPPAPLDHDEARALAFRVAQDQLRKTGSLT